jgi:allophanate hydrolase
MDVLLLPTVCEHPTPEAVAAEPVGVNTRMGRFTNFANLLDTCALAVPITAAPAGITLFAPAWHDLLLARLGAAVQDRAWNRPRPQVITGDDGGLDLAVFGAHRAGFPLHGQLLALGARFVRPCRTAPVYHVYRLPGTIPRPALVHGGTGTFAGEIYRLPAEGVGRLLATIAPPLGLGTVELEDGTTVRGFISEGRAAVGAEDITAWGAWR